MKIITTGCSKIEDSVRTTSPPSSLISCFLLPLPSPLSGVYFWLQRLQRLGSRLGAAAGKSQGGTACRSRSADWWALASLQLHQTPPIVMKSLQSAANLSSSHLRQLCFILIHLKFWKFFIFEGLFKPSLEPFAFESIPSEISCPSEQNTSAFSLCAGVFEQMCYERARDDLASWAQSSPVLPSWEMRGNVFTSCAVVLVQPGLCHTSRPL